MGKSENYQPSMSAEEIERREKWQDFVYENNSHRTESITVNVEGCELVVTPEVFSPVLRDSLLLAKNVSTETKAGEKVLDMFTGSGVQAIMAAKQGAEVLAVDINPSAVQCAKANAERLGLENMTVLQGDLFSPVNPEEKFDLITGNPPFRWFAPRDMAERAELDENYAALRRFFQEAKSHLTEGGRLLAVFADSGDLAYFEDVANQAGYAQEIIDTEKDEQYGWTYNVYRMTIPQTEQQ
ncbi:MAG: methyltransferase [Patescibacteria group bacterium]|nr:methyltransferase [Patescibacteria group bacterium]